MPIQDEVAVAREKVRLWERNVQTAPTPDELAIAESKLNAARAALVNVEHEETVLSYLESVLGKGEERTLQRAQLATQVGFDDHVLSEILHRLDDKGYIESTHVAGIRPMEQVKLL